MARSSIRVETARGIAKRDGGVSAAAGTDAQYDADADFALSEQKFASVTGGLIVRSANQSAPHEASDATADFPAAVSPLLARKGEAAPSALEPPPSTDWSEEEWLAAFEAELEIRIAECRQSWQAEADAQRAEWEADVERMLADARAAGEQERAEALARAETEWRAKLAKAAADARAAIESRDAAHAAQLSALREELREQARRDREAELHRAEEAWKAREAERLAAINTQARAESDVALAEATARYESAEFELDQARGAHEIARERDRRDIAALREELANLRTMFAAQDIQLQNARATLAKEGLEVPGEKLMLRPDRMRRRAAARGEPQPSRRRTLRDAALTAILAASAILLLPRSGISVFEFGHHGPASAEAEPAPQPATLRLTRAQPEPIAGRAVLVHGANFRAAPSGKSDVIATLPSGVEVATLERRGDWMHVRVVAKAGSAPQEGWVYASFLKSATSIGK